MKQSRSQQWYGEVINNWVDERIEERILSGEEAAEK
jgi:hypothetical protein